MGEGAKRVRMGLDVKNYSPNLFGDYITRGGETPPLRDVDKFKIPIAYAAWRRFVPVQYRA